MLPVAGSLPVERLDGISPRCAPRRQEAGDQHHQAEQDPDDREGERIGGLDAVEQGRHQASGEERGDGSGRIQPKKADEFVCQSCFLVKHRRQLADEDLMLCVDCV